MNKLSRIITVAVFLLICTLQPNHHVQGRVQSDTEERHMQADPYQLPPPSTAAELAPTYQTGGAIYTVQIQGNRAYVGQGSRLISLDITDPLVPKLLDASDPMSDIVQSIFVTGDRAYVSAGSDGLRIFDITDPANLVMLSHLPVPGEVQSLYISENTIYVAAGRGGVLIIDSSDPANPQEVGIYRGATSAGSVAVYNNRLYVADGKNGVKIVDITDPESPSKVAEYTEMEYAHDISIQEYPATAWAYVTTGQGGMHILDLKEPDSPTLIGVYGTSELSGRSERQFGASVLFLADGSGYIYFVDTADPTDLVEVATHRTGGDAEQAAATSDGLYLYVADGDGGLRVLVLSQDGVKEVATSLSPSWVMNMVFADESTQTAYLADRTGIKIFNMADPASPELLGNYNTAGKALDLAVLDNMLYVADGPNGLLVLDISDPVLPEEVKSYDTSGNAQGIAVEQTDEGKIITYVADGSGGLQIIDMSGEPRLIDLDGDLSAVTGVEIHDKLLYVTDEVVGLRLIDIEDPTDTDRLSETRTDGAAQDVTVKDDVAYVADGSRGLQLFNIANPEFPHKMGHYALPDARGVTVVGMTAYVADGREGLKMIDVRDPVQPRRMSDHRAAGVGENVTMHGDQVFLSNGSGGFTILQFAGDGYENDDQCDETTNVIPVDGTSQDHNFHKAGDEDWLRFEGKQGVSYRIDVQVPQDSLADVSLELYPECGGTGQEPEPSFSASVRLVHKASTDSSVYIRLLDYDPTAAGPNVIYNVSVRKLEEEPTVGAAIIVAGRYEDNDRLQPNIDHLTDRAYAIFQNYRYTRDDIKYLVPGPSIEDYQETLTKESLKNAIVDWAKEKVDSNKALTIYIVDHGDENTIYLDQPNEQRVSSADLKAWLSEIGEDVPINVIIEACFSGSFVKGEHSIGGKNRIVITSSREDWVAYASRNGAHFSDVLWTALDEGLDVAQSFKRASDAVNAIYPLQRPQLDADGDGISNKDGDIELASLRGFAFAGTFPPDSLAPYIADVDLFPIPTLRSANVDEDSEYRGEIEKTSRIIRAEVRDDGRIESRSVWAVIYPPFYNLPFDGPRLLQDSEPIEMVSTGGDYYEVQYDEFIQGGIYRIAIYAEDGFGRSASPKVVSLRIGEVVFLPFISH